MKCHLDGVLKIRRTWGKTRRQTTKQKQDSGKNEQEKRIESVIMTIICQPSEIMSIIPLPTKIWMIIIPQKTSEGTMNNHSPHPQWMTIKKRHAHTKPHITAYAYIQSASHLFLHLPNKQACMHQHLLTQNLSNLLSLLIQWKSWYFSEMRHTNMLRHAA